VASPTVVLQLFFHMLVELAFGQGRVLRHGIEIKQNPFLCCCLFMVFVQVINALSGCRGQHRGSSSPENPFVRRHLRRDSTASRDAAASQDRGVGPTEEDHSHSEIFGEPPSDPLNAQRFAARDPLGVGERDSRGNS